MRTTMTLTLAVLLSLGFAVTSFAAITGSAHDLRNWGGNGEDRICAFCHTPHHALTTGAPLWSRAPSTTAYTPLYDSNTFDGTISNQLAGPSGLCMSCHDGVLAVDSYYGATGGTGSGSDNWGGYAVGLTNGLGNDHPIGFTYDTALATTDGELHDPASATFVGSPTSVTVASVLSGGIMTCATCHDVHNSKSLTGAETYLLYGTQVGSGICLSCHDK